MSDKINTQSMSDVMPGKEAAIETLNPIGQVMVERLKPAPRIADLNNKKICLFWNGKKRGDLALKRVKELFMEKFVGVDFNWFTAKTYSETIHPDEIDTIRGGGNEAIIATTGD